MELVWETDAYTLWEDTARYIEHEFGYVAMVNYINETCNIELQLATNPNLGIIEPLLKKCSVEFRSILLSKHNKIIYYVTDRINIVDLWDTRREPKSQAKHVADRH